MLILGSIISMFTRLWLVSRHEPPNMLAKYELWHKYTLCSFQVFPNAITSTSEFSSALYKAWYIYWVVVKSFFLKLHLQFSRSNHPLVWNVLFRCIQWFWQHITNIFTGLWTFSFPFPASYDLCYTSANL